MAAGRPVRPYAGPLGIPEGNKESGVNHWNGVGLLSKNRTLAFTPCA